MRVLAKTASFGALLSCALPFMQDRKSKDLQSHHLFYKPREDPITRNLRVRETIKNEKPSSKLWTL